MKLPEFKNAERYAGLYVADFGDRCCVGFTANEIAELLESQCLGNIKVYKIYKAYPDGKVELRGVPAEIFNLEMGMFFYSGTEQEARSDYKRLLNSAIQRAIPARAKVHLARYAPDKFATAIIYPAEHNDEFSRWLSDSDYKTAGAAEGGIEAVERYYRDKPEVIESQQLFERTGFEDLSGAELALAANRAFAR